MRPKSVVTAAAACLLGAAALLTAPAAAAAGYAPSVPGFNASKLDSGEKAFMADLVHLTGNSKALAGASGQDVKRIAQVFRTACAVKAADREKALSSQALSGKLNAGQRKALVASWEKNLCRKG